MAEYLRTTRECALDDLNPVLAVALCAHSQKHQLGDIHLNALICCETSSTKQKKGLFGGKPEIILTGLILTPGWLIWATTVNGAPAAVLSARLRDIQVLDYEKSTQYKLIPDTGLDVSGLRMDTIDLGSAFIGLGPEPAAQKLRTLLKQALATPDL